MSTPTTPTATSPANPSSDASTRLLHASRIDGAAALASFDSATASLSRYINAELASTTQDYRTLEAMNISVKDKCVAFSEKAQGLIAQTAQLQQSYARLPALLDRVAALDAEITFLEEVAKDLEDYTRHVEAYAKKSR
ncbi:hypothetical protein HDU93_002028 [Gonapodya sp. JEL0774]|nr:hypothetical protein HDU93_002028 [Gonapodya sp. JEL0774]